MLLPVKAPEPDGVRDCVSLSGIYLDRVDLPALMEWIERFIASGKPHQVVTANVDFLAIARRRPRFARILDTADLVLCDGKPLQWASRIQGRPIPARITGMDLVLATAQHSARRGYRLYLMGAGPGVAARAAQRLRQVVPGVVIAGAMSPSVGVFDGAEDHRIVERIRAARPDALFVALGAPRQEEWIHDHLDELGVPLCAGVGGVFDFLAGETRRAPAWIQRAGMEWAFRLAQEPTRLWRRYLVHDLPICVALLTQQASVHWHSGAAHAVAPHDPTPTV